MNAKDIQTTNGSKKKFSEADVLRVTVSAQMLFTIDAYFFNNEKTQAALQYTGAREELSNLIYVNFIQVFNKSNKYIIYT